MAGSDLLLLDLDGNQSWLDIRVSIPAASAAVTFVGCWHMLFVGLLVVYSAHNQKKQTALQHALTPHDVVEMVLDSRQHSNHPRCFRHTSKRIRGFNGQRLASE